MITAFFVKAYNSVVSFFSSVKAWFKKMFVRQA